ncbi:ABC transporter ATP-binding protein/permease [Paenibacillus alginolyticus]|uniref:ABC transporter ATP-binding protein n=1 Tax=Paenibacillus alginolyticus TaxID=59839 RepID=UPI0003FDE4F9|nr:ABC transporter ATP-binding protein [Paenibacillus alginolyticus]MCY9666362.1 ABC transporter ATP-binding protein/permease [Paenibacillus alginolyticus]
MNKVTLFFSSVPYIIRSVSVILSISPFLALFLVMSTLTSSLIPIVQVYLTKEIINLITSVLSGVDKGSELYFLLVFQGIVVITLALLNASERLCDVKLQNNLTFHFDEQTIKKTLSVPYDYFEMPEFYNKLQRAANGSGMRIGSLFNNILSLVKTVFVSVGYVIILIHYNWMLSFAIFLPMIIVFVVNTKLADIRTNKLYAQTETNRKSSYLGNLFRMKGSAKEFRIFNHSEYIMEKRRDLYWKSTMEVFVLEKYLLVISVVPIFLSSLTSVLASVVLIKMGIGRGYTIGEYSALTQLLLSSQNNGNSLSSTLSAIYEDSLFVKQVLEFADLPDNIKEENQVFPVQLKEGIVVKNLTYRYPQNSNTTINNVSFHINPGEKVVIVGDNGAGKSTLSKCLIGLLQPTNGSVLVDGIEVNKINRKNFIQNVTILFQDFTKYNMSVKENIAFGDMDKLNDVAAINKVLKQTEVYNDIGKFPKKLDTELGSEFSESYDLSGGQWQKIALARAFLKKPQIVILDEPTASLDPISEQEIFNRFMELSHGKTAIFISHRLSTCVDADKILVMKHGELIEQGSHKELLKLNGEYATMFNTQAKSYIIT